MLIPTIFSDFINCRPKKGVLHIGAHICEEKQLYNDNGINDDNILWIEGNSDLINPEQKNILNAVISDKNDEIVDFIITNNMQSSSILELYKHLEEHPDVIEIGRRQLKTITLNTLYENNNISYDRYDFINLDIQGAELKALKGADKILPHIKAIYTEVSTKELYKNCALLPELDEFLEKNGFKRIIINMTRHSWGDALYIKE
jgi:FkbM family methyltransferase